MKLESGQQIRLLRRQLGLTQNQLSEALNVDQSTVSRWERGIEEPRPKTFAALRDLLLKDNDDYAATRYRALLKSDLVPAALVDARHRLVGFSNLADKYYRERFGLSLKTQIGWSMERHVNRLGMPQVWTAIQQAGLGRESLLWMRMIMNFRGKGHATIIEPIYKDGTFAGWSSQRTMTFDFPPNDEYSLERLEVVHADDPEHKVTIVSGSRALPF